MRLRLLVDPPLPGAENMARDAALLAAQRPDGEPLLRLYRWSPPAVSLGYNQDAARFDAAAIAARGWDLVRRPTGGRAILHHQELTYALVGASPSPLFGATLHSCYEVINRALLGFLRDLGIEAEESGPEPREALRGASCFRSAGQHEIRVGGRKLIGSAQRRTGSVFLQHGSILTGPAHAELAAVIADRDERGRDEAALRAATTDLSALLGRTLMTEAELDELQERLAAAFAAALALPPSAGGAGTAVH